MSDNALRTPHPPSGIAAIRRRVLRIHGTMLTLVALTAAVTTTMGRIAGIGPFGFLQQNPLGWVGLIQAYLLMTIIAVLLVLGSRQADPRRWDAVGALAHCAPLLAALSSIPLFASMGALYVLLGFSIPFHTAWICVETFLVLYPNRSR